MKPAVVPVITDDDVLGKALGWQISGFRSFSRARITSRWCPAAWRWRWRILAPSWGIGHDLCFLDGAGCALIIELDGHVPDQQGRTDFEPSCEALRELVLSSLEHNCVPGLALLGLSAVFKCRRRRPRLRHARARCWQHSRQQVRRAEGPW